jgi:hypothetical protein
MTIVAAAAFAACGDDDDTTVNGGGPPRPAELTAAWQGEWDLAFVATVCGETDTVLAEGGTEFLCEGDEITAPFLPWEISCEGTVTDTRVDVECDTTYTIGPCRVSATVDWTITRTGDDFAGTAMVELMATGGCEPDTTICLDIEFTGTRIGDGSLGCTVTTGLRPWPVGERVAGVIRRWYWATP